MSRRTSITIREAHELTPENLQKLLKVVSAFATDVQRPRSNWFMLIPWRPFSRNSNPKEFPFRHLGLLNLMTYTWMTSVVYKIYKKGSLDSENVLYAPYEERAQENRQRMEKLWNQEHFRKIGGRDKMKRVLVRHSLALFLGSFLFNLLGGIASLICPTVLFRWLLEYAQGQETNFFYGCLLVALAFSMECLRCFLYTGSMFLSILCAARLKAGFMSLMYEKILRVRGMQGLSTGELINLFANDSQRLFDFCVYVPSLFMAPVLVVSALVFCTLYIGPWCLIGSVFIGVHLLYQVAISKANSYIRSRAIYATDRRVQLMAELLSSIRTIKLNVWEESFAKRITENRSYEERCLRRAAYIQMVSIALIPLVTLISLATIFGGYIGTGAVILPAQD